MERPVPSYVKIGEKITFTPFGTKQEVSISVTKRLRRPVSPPDGTSLHEAAHVVAAQADGGIHEATRQPSSTYLGATWPVNMTAASAMAAAALGFDGTGWDEFLTKHLLGVDPESAKSSALSALSGRMDYLQAVAEKLQERGTIGQKDVDEAYREVDEKKQGIWDVQINVTNADGTTTLHETRSKDDTVMVEGEWVILGKKDEKEKQSVILSGNEESQSNNKEKDLATRD